ncbi:MAG: sigma 54-interacting transcriptional regulator [Myxococcota bacterium]
MEFLSDRERDVLEALRRLALGNPFGPERVESEAGALGGDFTRRADVWHEGTDLATSNPNVDRVGELVERWAPELRRRLEEGARASREELRAYEALVFYLLYDRMLPTFTGLLDDAEGGRGSDGRIDGYRAFEADARHFLQVPGRRLPLALDPAHLFAWGWQIRRAFDAIFRGIQGGSKPAARLRADIWQSIFTHDSERYGRSLYPRMGDVTTLILGESGTGKELVAQAMGLSRYIPFDPGRQAFQEDFAGAFRPVNLSALSPALIESELFGHRKGAFTGASEDRAGWLETCSPLGTVFLDEIGELDASIQVKLLRVLQSRDFQRVGETRVRRFEGKLVAATNRDLPGEIEGGRFREDLYYRLCADLVRTPTLREQIADSPDELPGLISQLARRIVGEDDAPELTREVVDFVDAQLGRDYPWPGNVRELEQCVRNVLIHGRYEPARRRGARAEDPLVGRLDRGELTADELLRLYCTRVYARTRNYEETGRRLGLDRRTVKAKVDPGLLETLDAAGAPGAGADG